MDAEIESHVEMRVADLVRGGLSPEQARDEAMRRFGELGTARRQLHDAARQRDAALRQRRAAGSLLADLRYGLRQVRRAPGFSAIAVATLALGLGATTAMFTLVQHVLLAPLPFPHADQLVSLAGRDSARNHVMTVSAADWQDWQRGSTPAVAGIALSSIPWRQAVVVGDSAMHAMAVRVTANYFIVLEPRFAAGRGFTADDATAGSSNVVISERLWHMVFAGDPRLAQPFRTTARSYTVVGVVAAGQEQPEGTDVWFPAAMGPEGAGLHNNINWIAIGRLAPGATAAQASAQLDVVARRIRASDPDALYSFGVDVRPLRDELIGDAAGYLRLLMGVVGVVLLIVCANVAAAGLGRASARGREMAIRASLGATRWRLVQQLLVEHVMLALVGGALGLGLAWAGVRGLLALWGGEIPRAAEVSLDTSVFAFAFAASLFAGVAAGLLPALRVSRVSLRGMLAAGGRTAARGGRNLAGATLVASEIALAVVLLTGAMLLIRSFRAVVGRDLGFDTNVATAEISLPVARYGNDQGQRVAYWNSLLASYRSIPGARRAGLATWLPLGVTGQSFIEIPGRDLVHAGAVYRPVSDGFLETLGVPLIAGRSVEASDAPTSAYVVVINRRLAAKYWPGESPIGKQIRAPSMAGGPHGEPAPWMTVVGVVADIRTWGQENDGLPEMYIPFAQAPGFTTSTMTAVVRGNAPAARYLDVMNARARRLEPLAGPELSTLQRRLGGLLASRTMTMTLLSAFAGLALVLAALGVYGVLSYAVTQRTRELAVRAALGAQRTELLSLIVRAGLRVVVVGAVVGMAAGMALTRLLSDLLVDVAPNDPRSYALAFGVLMAVALTAILVPAWRATRLSPLIALQAE